MRACIVGEILRCAQNDAQNTRSTIGRRAGRVRQTPTFFLCCGWGVGFGVGHGDGGDYWRRSPRWFLGNDWGVAAIPGGFAGSLPEAGGGPKSPQEMGWRKER